MNQATEKLIKRARACISMADTGGLQVSGPNIKVTAFYEAPALLEEAIAQLEKLATELANTENQLCEADAMVQELQEIIDSRG
jgi:hypothetical protein